MGTSKGYSMPSGGEWTPLKHEATDFVKNPDEAKPEPVVSAYIRAFGGAGAFAARGNRKAAARSRNGDSSGGGGGSGAGSTRAARSTAQAVGAFIGDVARDGFAVALERLGLAELVGRPPDEVVERLLDSLAAPGTTLDAAAARHALDDILGGLLENASSYEDLVAAFEARVTEAGLRQFLGDFYGAYVYELFSRDFYENWAEKVGIARAEDSLKQIEECMRSEAVLQLAGRELLTFDWRGPDAEQLAQTIMEEVLRLFEKLR